jgi:hypothetical protein
MPAWSTSNDLKTYFSRGISLRGMVFCLAILAVLISEVRFSWVEVLTGRFLMATNSSRPESGSVWEQGRLRQVATQTLEQMVTRQLTAQREAREAASLDQLVAGLADDRGTMISADRFRTLYSKIPEAVARTLFSPIRMLRISAEKSWDRVYLERENGQVGIYLLDRANNVLSYTTLNDRQLESAAAGTSLVTGSLDNLPEFAGRIYPADRFFMALDTLPPEVQRGVLPRPETILAVDGTPMRVGFSDEVRADMIRMGIELQTPRGIEIMTVLGQEWAVWQVRTLLQPPTVRPTTLNQSWPPQTRSNK